MNLFELEEVGDLVEALTAASEAYYLGKPIMSDQVYDAKEFRLKELDPTNTYFSKVGSNSLKESTFEKVRHEIPLLSLDKAYSLKEVTSWRKRVKGLAMPKMDGFALSLLYERQGEEYILVRAATRGEGDIGSDVTENVKQIEDVPKSIHKIRINDNFGDKFEVRGEAYMKHSVLSMLDIKAENCRNIAPGSVQQKNPLVTKSRKLNFFAYNLLGTDHNSMMDKIDELRDIGFEVVTYIEVDLSNDEAIEAAYSHYNSYREHFDFDIDGVVFMIDDTDLIEELGNTSHHPRGAIAWKFEAEEGETTFVEYQWQVSRTGLANPVGIFEGIRLDGATLTNATVYNLSQFKKLNLGVGDKIMVSRRGGVIPKIERAVTHVGKPIEHPWKCPSCGSSLEIQASKDGVETLHCIGLDCPAQTLTNILHFVTVMDIMDVGESLITDLIEKEYVKTCVDLFRINRGQLLTLDGVQNKKAERTLKNINLARKKPLFKFLAALGISNLGASVSESVADYFENIDNVLKATADDFRQIPGIGDVMGESIYRGLITKTNIIEELRKEIEIIGVVKKIEGCLNGKSFLITGTLSKSRGDFESMIKNNGGILKSSVSKALDYLIVGDNPGSKLEKAKKAGVNIIFEDNFLTMIGGN